MDELQNPTPLPSGEMPGTGAGLPGGDHPLEVAARNGLGPLSSLAGEIWHGYARPCVSCGQLVHRKVDYCESCGQDLSEDMLERMRAHAGPWYVLEHLRPFPGVSLERIIRQVRRGLITETSIVRGPSTDYQWRFAVEAPGLCRYFGKCWNCHEEVSTTDIHCRYCLAELTFEIARTPAPMPAEASPAVADASPIETLRQGTASPPTHQPVVANVAASVPIAPAREFDPKPPADGAEALRHLSDAVGQAVVPVHGPVWDEPPRLAGIRATWIAAGMIVVVVIALMLVAQLRSSVGTATPAPTTSVSTSPG